MRRVYKFQATAMVRLSGTNFDFERKYFDLNIIPGGDDGYNKIQAKKILESEGFDVQDIVDVTVIITIEP